MDTANPRVRLLPGDILYGFCAGWFGRDSYEMKHVEAVGADWVVARDDTGLIHFASGTDVHDALMEFLQTELR